ncbi:MAG TPA: hypothetical protein VEZ11_10875 [Thermoanaerobaculia bacterium]|nr:hypothetical protein [Thermoanaerobaculia bacterium]
MHRETSQAETDQPRGGAIALRPVALFAIAVIACAIVACQKREPLTAAKAESLLSGYVFNAEPVYAEVPQKVWFGPKSPMDDFDARSLVTYRNLQNAGLITVTETHDAGGTSTYEAKVTQKGFPILGTAPSVRGAVFRGKICEKKYDGLRNFQRHPNDPTVGNADLVWHYDNPTPLYPMFETKINKPLRKPFASLVSFFYKDYDWKFEVTANKIEMK